MTPPKHNRKPSRTNKPKLKAKMHAGQLLNLLKHNMATRVAKQFVGIGLPDGYTRDLEKYLGYKMWQLKRKLDEHCKETYGLSIREALDRGFHIDHAVPLCSFAPQSIGDDEFRNCWAISNLVLVPAEVNLSKGSSTGFRLSPEDQVM